MAYQDLVASIYSQIDNKNEKTLPFIRESVVRQLKLLGSTRVGFVEKTTSFNTVAEQAEYGEGDVGFPLDVLSFDYVYRTLDSGEFWYEIEGPVGISDARYVGIFNRIASNPAIYAVYKNKMILGPIPKIVMSIHLDYTIDVTKDDNGNLITTTSTTATNGWFEEGEPVLRNAVLKDYHASISGDQFRYGFVKSLYDEALVNVKNQYRVKRGTSRQAPRRLSSVDAMEEIFIRRR